MSDIFVILMNYAREVSKNLIFELVLIDLYMNHSTFRLHLHRLLPAKHPWANPYQRLLMSCALCISIGIGLNAQDRFERLYTTENTSIFATGLALTGESYVVIGAEMDTSDNRFTRIHVQTLTNKGNLSWSNTFTYEDTVRIADIGDVVVDPMGNVLFSATLERDSLNKIITALDPNGNVLWSKVTGAFTDLPSIFRHKPSLLVQGGSGYLMSTQIDVVSPDILLSSFTIDGELAWQQRMSISEAASEKIEDMVFTVDSLIAVVGSTTDPTNPIFLSKMDTFGEVIWSFGFDQPFRDIIPEGIRLNQTTDSSFVITGTLAQDRTNPEQGFVLHVNKDGSLRRARLLRSTVPTIGLSILDAIVFDTGNAILGIAHTDVSTLRINGLVVRYDLDSSFGYQTLLDSVDTRSLYRGQMVTPDSMSAAILVTAPYANGNIVPYLSKIDELGKTFCEEAIALLTVDSIGFNRNTLTWSIDSIGAVDSIEVIQRVFNGFTPPTLSLQDTTYCPQDPIRYIVDATTRGAVGYRWDDDNTDSIRLFTEEGMYMVTISIGQDLCYELCDTVMISVADLPMVNITPNFGSICQTGEIFLTASGSGAITEIIWSNGANTRTISVTQPGSYSVQVTDQCGNRANASFALNAGDFTTTLPISVTVTTENVCTDGTITLTASTDNANGLMWSTGASNVLRISVSQPGQFTVTRDNEFCDERGTATVTAGQFVQPINARIIESCTPLPSYSLSVDGTGIFARRWDNGESSVSINVDEPGFYEVTLTDGCGETEVIETEVTEAEFNACRPPITGVKCLRWPNAFVPEGDNENNKTFGPESDCDILTSYELHIFNRWGQEIFVSNNVNTRWNGQKDGKFVPGDVYFYWAKYSDGTEEFKDEGDLTVLR